MSPAAAPTTRRNNKLALIYYQCTLYRTPTKTHDIIEGFFRHYELAGKTPYRFKYDPEVPYSYNLKRLYEECPTTDPSVLFAEYELAVALSPCTAHQHNIIYALLRRSLSSPGYVPRVLWLDKDETVAAIDPYREYDRVLKLFLSSRSGNRIQPWRWEAAMLRDGMPLTRPVEVLHEHVHTAIPGMEDFRKPKFHHADRYARYEPLGDEGFHYEWKRRYVFDQILYEVHHQLLWKSTPIDHFFLREQHGFGDFWKVYDRDAHMFSEWLKLCTWMDWPSRDWRKYHHARDKAWKKFVDFVEQEVEWSVLRQAPDWTLGDPEDDLVGRWDTDGDRPPEEFYYPWVSQRLQYLKEVRTVEAHDAGGEGELVGAASEGSTSEGGWTDVGESSYEEAEPPARIISSTRAADIDTDSDSDFDYDSDSDDDDSADKNPTHSTNIVRSRDAAYRYMPARAHKTATRPWDWLHETLHEYLNDPMTSYVQRHARDSLEALEAVTAKEYYLATLDPQGPLSPPWVELCWILFDRRPRTLAAAKKMLDGLYVNIIDFAEYARRRCPFENKGLRARPELQQHQDAKTLLQYGKESRMLFPLERAKRHPVLRLLLERKWKCGRSARARAWMAL
ncbi:hypothetical protein BDZ91DRAFT_811647 [Kalaharituber pfeilii]|nr:hypothetical protein BDZ91DRAFT_811647 [Kalaharituber pfeilii]